MKLKFDYRIESGYLSYAFSPTNLPIIVNETVKFLRRQQNLKNRQPFNAIVVRGVSGMLVGSPVAYRMKLPLVVVRKSDGNHSGQSVEGFRYIENYVVIDDFVASGDTIREIREKVGIFTNRQAKMTGLVCYAGYPSDSYNSNSNEWDCWIKLVGKHSKFYKPTKK